MSKLSMMTIGLVALAWVGLGAAAAFADEVSTTTTVTHTEPQADVVVVKPPVVVEHGSDCVKSKSVSSDDETGEVVSKTVKKCD